MAYDSAERIIAAIGHAFLCTQCISLKSGVPLGVVPGYLIGIRNAMKIIVIDSTGTRCDSCHEVHPVYRVA